MWTSLLFVLNNFKEWCNEANKKSMSRNKISLRTKLYHYTLAKVGITEWSSDCFFALFAMAKIRRIGHDHQIPCFFFFLLLLFFSALQAWHEAKTSCHMHNTTRTPNIFTYSGPKIKLQLEGLIKGPPTPLTPQKLFILFFFFLGGGVITDGTFRPQ